ncbi:MAG: PstS family phosphate ABC transporter substrate-binding protein [Chloroflexi bacterium]|nr:PstS family phosphate ABC transporter substrate-binding protein [Chloroflexota bacterium]
MVKNGSPWRRAAKGIALPGLLALAVALAACGPAIGPDQSGGDNLRQLSGTVKIDGSSTVFPISEAMAEEFQAATGGRVRVTVGISGTGGGFQKFCNDETDISDASRPIRASEIATCQAAGITFVELPVAYDGLSVVVSPRNTFVDCMKVSELKQMWEPAAQGTVTRWSQVRAGWPDRPFRLYGAGPDSGTFDYFTEAVNGKEKASRGDYTASEDDNVLVQGISSDPDALGYFGYAYYAENRDQLKLVSVAAEQGGGCIAPTQETIANGTYQPLSRPIFIYVKVSAMERPEVREFVRFYLDPKNAQPFIQETGYVPFPDQYYQLGWQRFETKQAGTVFGGKAAENVTLDDLFRRTPS